MNILLFGKTGLLGSSLLSVLQKDNLVIAPSHDECDILKVDNINKYLKLHSPDIVINATGYSNVDGAESEKEKAFELNAGAVENLVNCLKQTKIPLVHFSTDYVFDGKKTDGYVESDAPSPVSAYGESKAKGEKVILDNLSNYFLIRTAWMFGPGGRNFVDAILEQARGIKPIRVVNDQFGCPTFSFDLAEAVSHLLKSKKYGIYHLVNDDECSWYDFAVEIFNQLGIPQEITPITSEELNRKAERPKYSVLKNTKLPHLRNWKDALASYLMNKEILL